MSTEDERAQREASREMSRRIREAAGFGGPQEDTNGETVRDERGRFVTGQGLDGGSRGASGASEPDGGGSLEVSRRMREALGMDTGGQ